MWLKTWWKCENYPHCDVRPLYVSFIQWSFQWLSRDSNVPPQSEGYCPRARERPSLFNKDSTSRDPPIRNQPSQVKKDPDHSGGTRKPTAPSFGQDPAPFDEDPIYNYKTPTGHTGSRRFARPSRVGFHQASYDARWGPSSYALNEERRQKIIKKKKRRSCLPAWIVAWLTFLGVLLVATAGILVLGKITIGGLNLYPTHGIFICSNIFDDIYLSWVSLKVVNQISDPIHVFYSIWKGFNH